MLVEVKILIYWTILVMLSLAIARLKYKNSNLNWHSYMNYTTFGSIYFLLSRGWFYCIIIYIFVQLTVLFFTGKLLPFIQN